MMHRDLKPGNVFVGADGQAKLGDLGLSRLVRVMAKSSSETKWPEQRPGPEQVSKSDGQVKLRDLGLSRYFSSRTLQALSTVGTPYYMSPECIKGLPYDFSSDIWSLGCLLYELVTLRNPFFKERQSLYGLGKSITNCVYEPLPTGSSKAIQELSRPNINQLLQRVHNAKKACDPLVQRVTPTRERALIVIHAFREISQPCPEGDSAPIVSHTLHEIGQPGDSAPIVSHTFREVSHPGESLHNAHNMNQTSVPLVQRVTVCRL
eukprot:gene30270-35259_t